MGGCCLDRHAKDLDIEKGFREGVADLGEARRQQGEGVFATRSIPCASFASSPKR